MVSLVDFRDPEKFKRLVTTYWQIQGVRIWGGLFASAIMLFCMFSSGHFSFLLTLSSLVSMFSFLMVVMTIETTKSVKGVSLKMMECYIAVFVCRLIAIVPFEGYLPLDRTGDWFYQVCESFCLCLAGSIVFLCRVQYASTYDPTTDSFNHLWIIGPALGTALVLHPRLNLFLFSDICWAFALYLESLTVLPQFFMFLKEGRAQSHTSHFLAAQALSRLLSFIFWTSSFGELSRHPDNQSNKYISHWLVGIQLLQLCVMGDFIFHYIRAIQKGIPVSEIMNYSTNV